MQTNDELPQWELEQRVIYALFAPIIRLAHRFGISLKELRKLLDTAYFQELRAMGMTHQEIAGVLQVSERTAGMLSKRAREQFMGPQLHHNIPRRIEFMLSLEPMGEGRLNQVMPEVDVVDVRTALHELLELGRIVEVPGRTLKYAPSATVRSLPRDTWLARIGGLNSLAENLTNVVFGRFFANEPRTFARTLTFDGGPKTFEQLTDFYQHTILPGLKGIHRTDRPEGDASQLAQVSMYWAPYEYMKPDPSEHEQEDVS
ncbi:MAG: hypothetical protein AAFS10_01880 [Myxococcota bacterium]